MMMLRSFAVTVFALASLGCNSDDARVTVVFKERELVPRGMLTLTITDGSRQWTFSGSNLSGSAPEFRTPALDTRLHGELTVAYVLRDGATEVSRGDVTLPLRSDWGYTVTIGIFASDPTEYCFGCMGKKQFTLAQPYRTTATDAVWVYWGGNSFKHPVVY